MEYIDTKNLIQDAMMEFKILSAVLLLDETERQKIFSQLYSEQFNNSTAKSAFCKFKAMYEQFPSADGASYLEVLDDDEKAQIITAAQNSMSASIVSSQLDDTLKAFVIANNRRQLKNEIINLSLESDIDITKLRNIVNNAEKRESGKSVQNSADKYIADYNKPFEYVSTGFEQMDNLLNGGFIKGTLATIGARPSTGKTTFAVNIAANNPDKKILFFSIEMSARMIYDRLIADKANINYKNAGLHQVQIETVKSVLKKYPDFKIIDNISRIEDIVNLIYSEKPDLTIIDFIQIVTSSEKFIDNRQRIDYISQSLKMSAKNTNSCILTLSQLTRAGKDKPTMSDLKESGGLEQDCDYVILLYREYVNNKSNKEISPENTTVILDKNKFGNTRELKYHFDGQYQRFTEEEDEIAHIKKEAITADDDLPF